MYLKYFGLEIMVQLIVSLEEMEKQLVLLILIVFFANLQPVSIRVLFRIVKAKITAIFLS